VKEWTFGLKHTSGTPSMDNKTTGANSYQLLSMPTILGNMRRLEIPLINYWLESILRSTYNHQKVLHLQLIIALRNSALPKKRHNLHWWNKQRTPENCAT
jgi:hypothetical protein